MIRKDEIPEIKITSENAADELANEADRIWNELRRFKHYVEYVNRKGELHLEKYSNMNEVCLKIEEVKDALDVLKSNMEEYHLSNVNVGVKCR